jgi:hypothetical protein
MPNMPGPGDPETWGPPMGHSNDPRTDPYDDECPICEEPLFDPNGCADCGYTPNEPDYEAMYEDSFGEPL